MKRIIGATLLMLALGIRAIAQEAAPEAAAARIVSEAVLQQRLQLAISSEEYPVTTGDVYRLAYTQADTQVVQDYLVESNYIINMKVFGAINATGMTFLQLKPLVEKVVTTAYPRSMPSLSIRSLGIFQVFLRGETPQAQSIVAWGLSRLSEIVESRQGPYASIRSITVTSRDGTSKTYDLFKAFRFGIVGEDPFMRPGDSVVLPRSVRRVEVAGAVRHPGTYELLPGEQFRELIEDYGGGTTSTADGSRLRIERRSGDQARIEHMSLAEGSTQGTPLANGDIVTVSSTAESLALVTFEGAVRPPPEGPAGTPAAAGEAERAGTAAFNRITYMFKQGETLSDAIRAIRASIEPLADLSAASVLHSSAPAPIAVDLRELLSNSISPSDMILQPNDRVYIPLLRYTVLVSGAVETPGSYPYVFGRSSDYYLSLAGGIDPERNHKGKVVHYDSVGNRRDAGSPIVPGDRLYAPSNGFTYNLNRYAPLVSAILGIIFTSVEIFYMFTLLAQ